MNWNERQMMLDELRENIAEFMLKHGKIKRDEVNSNEYCCARQVELTWRGIDFTITQVDGMTCLIERT